VTLAYLMHSWSLIESPPAALRRLGEMMCDLRHYHANPLDTHVLQATLCETADLIDELGGRPARMVRLKALGELPEAAR
jgi:hypothetical protein